MNKKEIKNLILEKIPPLLIQLEELRQMCGVTPVNGFAGAVLELVGEGLIVDGFTQNKYNRYPLRSYKRVIK